MAVTDAAIWVASQEDRTVSRYDLATGAIRTVGGAPVAQQVVAALNGDVWLSSQEEPIVTLIAPGGKVGGSFKAIAGGPSAVKLPGSAEGLATGGGSLWVTSPSDSGGHDSVFRIDLRTRRLVDSVRVGHLPLYVTFGYGSAWVANYKDDSVSVIRPGTDKPETIPVEGGPLGVAAGAGAIWVVAYWNRELLRIDPETRRVLHHIPVGAGPLAVTVGAGSVWVTNRDAHSITRIDPATNKVMDTIDLDASPHGIAFARGHVWVTTQRCGTMPC
jgi:YVTN family beta-propeller protein